MAVKGEAVMISVSSKLQALEGGSGIDLAGGEENGSVLKFMSVLEFSWWWGVVVLEEIFSIRLA